MNNLDIFIDRRCFFVQINGKANSFEYIDHLLNISNKISGILLYPQKNSQYKKIKRYYKDFPNITIDTYNWLEISRPQPTKSRLFNKFAPKILKKKYNKLIEERNIETYEKEGLYMLDKYNIINIDLLIIENVGLEDILLKKILTYFRPKIIKFYYIYLLYNSRLELKNHLKEDKYKLEHDGEYLIIMDTL